MDENATNGIMFKLSPTYKDYLWGGDKLKKNFNKDSTASKLAESWEFSASEYGMSTIVTGKYAGKSLKEVIPLLDTTFFGSNYVVERGFPLLIKLIDADKPLSIQVHPDDAYAEEVEHSLGKTEMWYVVDCDEDAFVYYGLNREVTKEEFLRRVIDNSLTEILNKVPVRRGDVFYIRPGTIHAIGGGIIICEFQENSNTTYRVYDYGRRDAEGNLRELHIDKAIDVIKLKKEPDLVSIRNIEQHMGYLKERLVACEYFTVYKYIVKSEMMLNVTDESFVGLINIFGSGTIYDGDNKITFSKGDTLFVSAGERKVKIVGNCILLVTKL